MFEVSEFGSRVLVPGVSCPECGGLNRVWELLHRLFTK